MTSPVFPRSLPWRWRLPELLVLGIVLYVLVLVVATYAGGGDAGLAVLAVGLFALVATLQLTRLLLALWSGTGRPRIGLADVLTFAFFLWMAYAQMGALSWFAVRDNVTVMTTDGQAKSWPRARVWSTNGGQLLNVSDPESREIFFFPRQKVVAISSL